MRRHVFSAWIGIVALLPMSDLLGAEPPPQTAAKPNKRATAELKSERHFDRGLAFMLDKNYASACPRLAISFRLDPRPGGLFTLAECLRKWNREESALALYQQYLVLVGSLSDIERERQRPRIRVARAQVRRMKRQLRDPHGTASLDRPTKDAVIPATATVSSSSNWGAHPPQDTQTSATWHYWTVGLGIFGGAALTAGAATGILAIDQAATVKAECDEGVCTEAGKTAWDRAKPLADVSTAGLAVGLSAVAASVGLYVFGPPSALEERKRPGLNMALGGCHPHWGLPARDVVI